MESQLTPNSNTRALNPNIDSARSTPPLGATRADQFEGNGFNGILTKQRGGITSLASDSQPNQSRIRHATEQLVATALVKPLLQQARDTPLDANLIDGGQGEKAFGKKLDNILADRIVSGANFPVVKAISDRLSQRYAHADKPYTGSGRQLDVSR